MNPLAKLFSRTPSALDIRLELKQIERDQWKKRRELDGLEQMKQAKVEAAVAAKKAGKQELVQDIFRDMRQIEIDHGYVHSDLRRLSLSKTALTAFLRKLEMLEKNKDHKSVQNLMRGYNSSSIQKVIDQAEVDDETFGSLLQDILGETESSVAQEKVKEDAGFAEFDRAIEEMAASEEPGTVEQPRAGTTRIAKPEPPATSETTRLGSRRPPELRSTHQEQKLAAPDRKIADETPQQQIRNLKKKAFAIQPDPQGQPQQSSQAIRIRDLSMPGESAEEQERRNQEAQMAMWKAEQEAQAEATKIIEDVVKNREAAMDRIADQWDDVILQRVAPSGRAEPVLPDSYAAASPRLEAKVRSDRTAHTLSMDQENIQEQMNNLIDRVVRLKNQRDAIKRHIAELRAQAAELEAQGASKDRELQDKQRELEIEIKKGECEEKMVDAIKTLILQLLEDKKDLKQRQDQTNSQADELEASIGSIDQEVASDEQAIADLRSQLA
jgi:hypothetical protein